MHLARTLRRSLAMREISCALFVLAVGCGPDTLDDATYRRLLDRYDTYDHCLANEPSSCYHTLTFCADGRANANLEFRQEGTYKLTTDTTAVAKLLTTTVVFDLETRTSPQLPGRHTWEVVDPLFVDCSRAPN